MKFNIFRFILKFIFLISFLFIAAPAFANGEPVTVISVNTTVSPQNILLTYKPDSSQFHYLCVNLAATVRLKRGIYPQDLQPSVDQVGISFNSEDDTNHTCTIGINANRIYLISPTDPIWIQYGDNEAFYTATFNINNNFVLPTPTPTPDPGSQIVVSPASGNFTVGVPFTANVVVNGGSTGFNAAQATVNVSPNLNVTGIKSPSTNSCNFDFTKNPTTSDPSFAGGIYGTSSTGCTAYTLVLTPTSSGTGTIIFTNASIKSFSDNSEILSSVQNGSFTINAIPTPTGTTTQTIDDSVQGTGQNQWNYNGSGWAHCTNCDETNPTVNFYNSSQSYDNVANDYVAIKFSGVQFNLYGVTDPKDGIGAISIDGGAETNVDFYSATRTGNVLLWTSPILSNSTHTLKLRVTGTHDSTATDNYIILDRGDISATTTLPNLAADTYPTNTYNSSLTITGTKDSSITTVFVNGSSSNITYPTSTTWQAQISLSQTGNNNFIIYGADSSNNQTASLSININKHALGDINGDGNIDLVDASLFAVDFGKTSNLTYPLSDMNGDGNVDLTDLSILAKLEQ